MKSGKWKVEKWKIPILHAPNLVVTEEKAVGEMFFLRGGGGVEGGGRGREWEGGGGGGGARGEGRTCVRGGGRAGVHAPLVLPRCA
jgi:hypothetical protein